MASEESRVEEQLIWLNDNGNETRLGTFSMSPKGKYSLDEATAFSCLSYPVPYSEGGSEQKKFWADLVEKGKKLPDNEAGFIFFWVDSGTHDEIDLRGALDWQITKFFCDYEKVTGVILRTEHVIASVPSPGSISWGPEDQKRYKIHWNPRNSWAVNEQNKITATLLEDLLS
jgi:hypothetical protein